MRNDMGINMVESISFIKKIPPGTDVLAERVKAAGTVEAIKIKFNAGQEGALRVRPVIEHKGAKIEDLVTYPETTERFLSGDDDPLYLRVNMPVDNDDYIKLLIENTSAFTYTVNCQVEIDYFAGKQRVVGGVI